MNLYAYVGNDPVNLLDPEGERRRNNYRNRAGRTAYEQARFEEWTRLERQYYRAIAFTDPLPRPIRLASRLGAAGPIVAPN